MTCKESTQLVYSKQLVYLYGKVTGFVRICKEGINTIDDDGVKKV